MRQAVKLAGAIFLVLSASSAQAADYCPMISKIIEVGLLDKTFASLPADVSMPDEADCRIMDGENYIKCLISGKQDKAHGRAISDEIGQCLKVPAGIEEGETSFLSIYVVRQQPSLMVTISNMGGMLQVNIFAK